MARTRTAILTGAALCGLAVLPAHALTITPTTDAMAMANAIAGEGVTILSATYNEDGTNMAGAFTGGAGTGIGIDEGIILTTGLATGAVGPNDDSGFTGGGTSSSLTFDFTTDTDQISFRYVFASEEYLEYVGSEFNDRFELRLDGVNIAFIPGTDTVVSINTINDEDNAGLFNDNTGGSFNLQYDGFTDTLLATATGLAEGTHTFEFFITDVGDSVLDSAVFIQAGSFTGTIPPVEPPPGPGPGPSPIPEPGTLVLLSAGLFGLMRLRRR